ncbi:MAG: thioredoxin family protein [Chitinophagaceae bacterium]
MILIFGSILLPALSFSQIKQYQFEQIDSLQKTEKKIVVVFIHTNWCKYCEAMKHTTFKNKELINTLNKNFYFINLDAEEKRSIAFNNNTFHYKPTGNQTGINELAEQLGDINGKVSFPGFVFWMQIIRLFISITSFYQQRVLKLFCTN